MKRETMIAAHDVRKTYGEAETEVQAIREVTVEIKKGEFVAIMGASGSGKSTLLHMLALLEKPTAGKLDIQGRNVLQFSDAEATAFRLQNIGYVFQEHAVHPELTALENVLFPALVKGEPFHLCEKRAGELLSLVGIGEKADQLPRQLSGGQKQRVAIARALINSPDIIFADEPCANLDSVASKNVLDILRTLNRKHQKTIVMVTHEKWHTAYVDRVITLKDGIIHRRSAK
jgi:putative ABC transport system ATP-binding protein